MLSLPQIEICIAIFNGAIKTAKKDADHEFQYGRSIYKQCKAVQRCGELIEIRKVLVQQRRNARAGAKKVA